MVVGAPVLGVLGLIPCSVFDVMTGSCSAPSEGMRFSFRSQRGHVSPSCPTCKSSFVGGEQFCPARWNTATPSLPDDPLGRVRSGTPSLDGTPLGEAEWAPSIVRITSRWTSPSQ